MTDEEILRALGVLMQEPWASSDNGIRLYPAVKVAIEALSLRYHYRWHDLRKSPEDLPEEHQNVYARFDFHGHEHYGVAFIFRDFNKEIHWVGVYGMEPIAWKHMERFEEENDGEKN